MPKTTLAVERHLHDQIKSEAARRGMTLEKFVHAVLAAELPKLTAQVYWKNAKRKPKEKK